MGFLLADQMQRFALKNDEMSVNLLSIFIYIYINK